MAEQTVPAQLTGHEIIEAICDRLKQTLLARGYPLRAGDSYDWFTAKIPTIELEMFDAGSTQKASYAVDLEKGDAPAEGAEVTHLETSLDIAKAPPNVVRVETGQPVPTLAKDGDGRSVVRPVQYARKDAGKAAKAGVLVLGFVLCGLARAQAVAQPGPPALSSTMQIALKSTMRDYQESVKAQNDALAQLRSIEADVRREYPGWHLNEANLTLEKDAPVPAKSTIDGKNPMPVVPASKPAPEKK